MPCKFTKYVTAGNCTLYPERVTFLSPDSCKRACELLIVKYLKNLLEIFGSNLRTPLIDVVLSCGSLQRQNESSTCICSLLLHIGTVQKGFVVPNANFY